MTIFGPYPATVASIHDGDTLKLVVDLGFDIAFTTNVRLYGINAPELATPAGKAALAFVETLVKPGDKVTVLSHGWDKYGGRADGDITLPPYGLDLAAALVASGNAKVWGGKGKKP